MAISDQWAEPQTGRPQDPVLAAMAASLEAAIVIPAVSLFRFLTFWLPIHPGWVALTYLRNSDPL